MSDTLFESEADARATIGVLLSKRLGERQLGNGATWMDVVPPGALTDRVEVELLGTATAAPATIKKYRYVIRSEDLKLAESVLDAINKLIPTGLLIAVAKPTALPIAAASIVIDALKLLKRLRDKGAVLGVRAYTVLSLLKSEGPTPLERLLTLLRAYDQSWTDSELNGVLAQLKSYPTRSGSPVALVTASADGREWRAVEF